MNQPPNQNPPQTPQPNQNPDLYPHPEPNTQDPIVQPQPIVQQPPPVVQQNLVKPPKSKIFLKILIALLVIIGVVVAAMVIIVSRNNSNNKAADESIKSLVALTLKEAQNYKTTQNSYVSYRLSEKLQKDASNLGAKINIQGETPTSVVIYAALKSKDILWCSDASGFIGEITELPSTQTVCK